MKDGIHPEYVPCKVHCACGNTFETRSSLAAMRVDICSACHPFYTGAQKFIDTAGRVDKFRKRYAATQQMGVDAKANAAKAADVKAAAGTPAEPKP